MYKIVIILIVVLAGFSCSKQESQDAPEMIFEQIKKTGAQEDLFKFYTNSTMRLLNRAVDDKIVEKKDLIFMLPEFSATVDWKVLSSQTSGDSAEVVLKFTGHHIENAIGMEKKFNLKKNKVYGKLILLKTLRLFLNTGINMTPLATKRIEIRV